MARGKRSEANERAGATYAIRPIRRAIATASTRFDALSFPVRP